MEPRDRGPPPSRRHGPADLRSFLQAIELALQPLDRLVDAFHITMQQLHPRLQVAPGRPEGYIYRTVASISRCSRAQASHLHMQITEPHDYRDLCTRLRSEPHLGEHYVFTAFLANLPQNIARDPPNQASAACCLSDFQYGARLAINFDTLARTYPGRGEQRQQDANTLAVDDNFYAAPLPPRATSATRDEPPAPQRSATQPTPGRPPRSQTPREIFAAAPKIAGARCQPPPATAPARGPPPRLFLPAALATPFVAPLARSCFFCGDPSHGHRTCAAYADACQRDPDLPAKCTSCRGEGSCPPPAAAVNT